MKFSFDLTSNSSSTLTLRIEFIFFFIILVFCTYFLKSTPCEAHDQPQSVVINDSKDYPFRLKLILRRLKALGFSTKDPQIIEWARSLASPPNLLTMEQAAQELKALQPGFSQALQTHGDYQDLLSRAGVAPHRGSLSSVPADRILPGVLQILAEPNHSLHEELKKTLGILLRLQKRSGGPFSNPRSWNYGLVALVGTYLAWVYHLDRSFGLVDPQQRQMWLVGVPVTVALIYTILRISVAPARDQARNYLRDHGALWIDFLKNLFPVDTSEIEAHRHRFCGALLQGVQRVPERSGIRTTLEGSESASQTQADDLSGENTVSSDTAQQRQGQP